MCLLGSTPAVPGRLWGVGIAVPGPVEFRTGRPISPPIMPGWDGYPIRETFVARYGAPVWVDNDVNVLALGEWRSGIAAGHDDIVVIKVGTGIGAGIISGGRLHRGAQGSAGDVGHIQVVDDRSVICRCGNVGCLEALAGGAAIGRAGEQAALRRAQRSADGGHRRARHGHGRRRRAGGLLWRSARGRAPADGRPPHRGRCSPASSTSSTRRSSSSAGGVANSPDQFLASIRETVYGRSLPLATRDLRIERSSLGGQAGVIGASAMVVDQLFARESIAAWIEVGDPSGLAVSMAASAA